jgi:hypothetical protein
MRTKLVVCNGTYYGNEWHPPIAGKIRNVGPVEKRNHMILRLECEPGDDLDRCKLAANMLVKSSLPVWGEGTPLETKIGRYAILSVVFVHNDKTIRCRYEQDKGIVFTET